VTGLEARKRRSRWLVPAVLPALLILILLAFQRQVLDGLGDFLVVSQPLEDADLIYVLAGDFWGSRVLLGAKLGAEGRAPKVVLSGGPYQGSCACDLAVEFAVKHGYPRSMFFSIPMQAGSTIDEAYAMRPVFERLGARRIILVTSNFHSRRAREVFRLLLPEFDFQMAAAPDSTFDPRAWWQTEPQRHLLFSEYKKMVGTILVRFHLATADWLRQEQS
jgi:uncharacterized SAM-binding protein YcdF (DUF218 family)